MKKILIQVKTIKRKVLNYYMKQLIRILGQLLLEKVLKKDMVNAIQIQFLEI